MLASVLQSSHEDNNSSGISQQEEILRSARANVGLIADGIWAPSGQYETYRKLNRALWIRVSGACTASLNFVAGIFKFVYVAVCGRFLLYRVARGGFGTRLYIFECSVRS